jgi:outer membrane protein TolC
MAAITRRILLIFLLTGFIFFRSDAQETVISLQDCYQLAASNAAISGNPQLLEQIAGLRLKNIDASRLPAIQWNGKATWQNEIFDLPFDIPGVDITVPLYNIQTNLEASYLLYDGGLAGARKKTEQAGLATDKQTVAVELNKLKDQVNQAFFGALLLQEYSASLALTRKDLEAKAAQLEAGVRHGAVLESDLKKVQVEQLKIQSKIAELQSDRRAMLAVLGSLTAQQIADEATLKAPGFDALRPLGETRRPELALFDLQKQQVLAAGDLIDANWNPKVAIFAQTGAGYPNPVNFFNEEVSPYFLGGVEFSWKFWDWKQAGRERQQLAVQSQLIENQKKNFEQNIGHQEGKFREDIAKIQAQIAADGEIAKLQGEILQQLSSQLEHGVITATDYLLQSNAELQARLNENAHRVQLAQVQAAWWTWKGWW